MSSGNRRRARPNRLAGVSEERDADSESTDLAITLELGMMAVAVTLFVVLVVAMLVAIHGDPESHIDAGRPLLPEQ